MPTQFPAVIQLSDLNGKNGFFIKGVWNGDRSGYSVASAGDINGDGIADLIIGAPSIGQYSIGQSYVIFGNRKIGNSGIIELSGLDGSNGFAIDEVDANDWSCHSVAPAGDVNNDSISDLIVGAPYASPNDNQYSGQSYVVFGGRTIGSSGVIQLSYLDGSNGFAMDGINASDFSGWSVASAGDVNNDSITDLIVGAYNASPNGNKNSGQSYVVFGGQSIGSSGVIQLSSLDGSNGFAMDGVNASDFSGRSVASAGDVNGDGITDLIVGAYKASPNDNQSSGQSYVVFGRRGIGSSGVIQLSSIDGSNGFAINGNNVYDYSGWSVASAGDVNGDGISDLIVGAPNASPNDNQYSGQSYVVFGGQTIGSSGVIQLSNLDGSNGFAMDGINARDGSGRSVASAGDVNGDGITDLIVGAPDASLNGHQTSGQSYVVFGDLTIGSSGIIELSSLDGSNGFALDGIKMHDFSGWSVASAGDVNGDGITDLIVGAPELYAGPGQSYVIFGDSIVMGGELSLTQAEGRVLMAKNLNATSINHPAGILQFQISALQHGHFAFISNPEMAITHFYQQNITDGQVQFTQDGSIYPPSFNISALTGIWAFTTPEAFTINFAPLKMARNELIINQNENVILTTDNIYALDSPNISNASIRFSVQNVTNGWFERVHKPSIVISFFTQADIMKANIQFKSDGSTHAPCYQITVSDGIYTLPFFKSNVTFYPAPQIEVNVLTIKQGQTITLTHNNLQAKDSITPTPEIIFSITALKHGYFEFITHPGQSITNFTQGYLSLGIVQFTQDGSPDAPSYDISAIGKTRAISAPNAADIYWEPKKAIEVNNTTRNILIGTFTGLGVLGCFLTAYISMGYLKNHRLNRVMKNKEGNELEYHANIVVPIAKAVFKQIKVTGFMNYISTDQMETYVSEIATVVNAINQLGIDIEIQHMNPEQSTELLTHIVKQMKQHLQLETSRCNRAWFSSFFKPQVTPEQIGEKAQAIAQSVHDALLGENKAGIINLPAHVDLIDVIGQAPSEKEFTTGYVQMP